MCLGFVENLLGQGAVAAKDFREVADIGVSKTAQVGETALSQQTCGLFGNAQGIHQMMYGATNLTFKDFGSMLILLDDQIHADQA